MFSYNKACVVYSETYGRGMSVSGRQRRGAELQRFRFSALPPADCHPSAVILAVYTTEFGCGGEQRVVHAGAKSAILDCRASDFHWRCQQCEIVISLIGIADMSDLN